MHTLFTWVYHHYVQSVFTSSPFFLPLHRIYYIKRPWSSGPPAHWGRGGPSHRTSSYNFGALSHPGRVCRLEMTSMQPLCWPTRQSFILRVRVVYVQRLEDTASLLFIFCDADVYSQTCKVIDRTQLMYFGVWDLKYTIDDLNTYETFMSKAGVPLACVTNEKDAGTIDQPRLANVHIFATCIVKTASHRYFQASWTSLFALNVLCPVCCNCATCRCRPSQPRFLTCFDNLFSPSPQGIVGVLTPLRLPWAKLPRKGGSVGTRLPWSYSWRR